MNLLSSKVELEKVEPERPVTESKRTISLSAKPLAPEEMILTVLEELVLVKVQPVSVVQIGWIS
jgi:hypothetical protein